MLDYYILKLLWGGILGILVVGFWITDGFDLGTLMLSPWLTKNLEHRRLFLNAIGPVWESNQIWLILSVGATFGTFPLVYGAVLSSLYEPCLIVLLGLIIRPVGMKVRSKISSPLWQWTWDIGLSFGSLLVVYTLGTCVAHILCGLDFFLTPDLRIIFDDPPSANNFLSPGSFLPLSTGLLAVSLSVMHGACYLRIKTPQFNNSLRWWCLGSVVAIVIFFILFACTLYYSNYYVLTTIVDPNTISTPLDKIVVVKPIATTPHLFRHFFGPYQAINIGFIIMLISTVLVAFARRPRLAFLSSCGIYILLLLSFCYATFPFILPSRLDPNHSLLLWDSSASPLTLQIMLVVTLILMPIILSLVAWMYRLMKGPVDLKDGTNEFLY